MGPEAALNRATETFGALGKLAQDLPQLVRNAEGLSQMVAEGGVRLHPDTARQSRRNRNSAPVLPVSRWLRVLAVIAAALLHAPERLF